MTAGILFSQMDPPSGLEAAFHEWYDDEQIPLRMALDGFARATRYRAVEGRPSHLAVYELSDLEVLSTPEYERIKTHLSARTDQMLTSVTGFTRYVCETVTETGPGEESPYLAVVAFEVPEEDASVLDEWHDSEHTPHLMSIDGWLRVSRYRRRSGEGEAWNRFTLHELRSLDALDVPERSRDWTAPLQSAVADRPWFRNRRRWLYQVIASVKAA